MNGPVYELVAAPEPGFERMVGWRFSQISRYHRTVVFLYESPEGKRIKLTLPKSDLRFFRKVDAQEQKT